MDLSQNATAGTGTSGGNGMVSNQTNDTATVAVAAASDDPKQNLNQVINSIQKTLGLLHQLYLTVSSFNAASQLTLLQRLNSVVTELDNMVKLSEKCNIHVPMEVLNLIDDGKNPDEFTRDVINSCIAKNQVTKGKTDAFKSLRKHHLEELEQTFPDEVEAYREIRASSAAESKRLGQSQSMLPNGDMKNFFEAVNLFHSVADEKHVPPPHTKRIFHIPNCSTSNGPIVVKTRAPTTVRQNSRLFKKVKSHICTNLRMSLSVHPSS